MTTPDSTYESRNFGEQVSFPTNEEIARIVGWSPQNVDRVRRFYVDDTAVVVALAKRIANASVKRSVKQGG